FAFSLVVHNNHLNSIANAGNPEHIERYLPRMLTGEVIGSFLLTEPQGGSDAAAITTSATRDGDGWRLNGRKAWVTNAAEADLLSVYAQTDPDKGWRGIATFQVEAERDGVVREAPYSTLGAHAMGTGGFRFEDCRVEDRAMLLPPGDGFKFAMSGIDLARACVAAMCCGILRTSLDVALGYAAGRRAFGQRIADFQGLQWQLADVATDLHAARLMAYEAMRLIDAGQAAAIEAAHAKKFATRVALTGVAECMQAMGADGYKHDFPLARHLACAKMGQYIDGTTEIQNVVIGRALLKPYID
ncbi:MAG: acyl-CoA dehydrogenase family protein, partial [Alphaproteobacteria bacterium]|nr:acyl-CoA dehydrogenase family protein [Alphaproteobacteria bacterium]